VLILTSSVTTNEISKCRVETIRTLEKILALESVPLFTQNTDFLKSERKKWLSHYTDIRASHNYNRRIDVEDQFHNALTVMADVRAYFEVGYKVLPSRISSLSDDH
jgi:vacuolar protein sorting-associated protein 1